MAYVIVTYYTFNTGYEEEVKNLIESVKNFNLPFDSVGIPDQGSWQLNTQFKGYFIKNMMIKHFPLDIFYLDADARLYRHPTLFDKVNFDIAFHYYKLLELLSGTLYFSNNAKVFELVERWISMMQEFPAEKDQKMLNDTVEQSLDLNLNIRRLPPEYCKIFDLMGDVKNPVIEHFQASRRFKKRLDSLDT